MDNHHTKDPNPDRSCIGKSWFSSSVEARKDIADIEKRDGTLMTWYRCIFCKNIHLAHRVSRYTRIKFGIKR